MKNKLLLNGLVFHGSTTPNTTSATKDAVQDLAAICQAEGADISTVSQTALSFSALVQALESHGLLKAANNPPPRVTSSVLETALSSAHRAAVSSVMKKQFIT